MKKILSYLKPYIGKMAIGFLIKVAGTFMDLGLPWVLAYMIDDVVPLGKVYLILVWGGVMLLLSIGARTGNIIANRMASRVAGDTVRSLRHDLFSKIEQLSGAQVDKFSIPSLISRMTTDTYNIHQMVGMMQRLGVRAPIILIGGTIITATLEPVLTLILIAILPILGLVVYAVSKKGIPIYAKSQATTDRLIRTVRENISGIRVIKALSKTEYEKNRFRLINEEVVEKELNAGSVMAIINPMMNLLLNVGLTLVVIVGAYRVNSGASEVGKIVAFLSYFTMILNAMLMITNIFVILSKATSSSIRIAEVLNTEEDLKVHSLVEYPIKKDSEEYHITFKNVSFAYEAKENDEDTMEETDSTCIKTIDFNIKKGESLGIIGSTGAGKTTLVNLLMRYYDVNEGSILIHGKDIRTIPNVELRKKFGVVFQNDTIFADTVKGNINFKRDLSEQAIEKASIDAQAMEFIKDIDDAEYQISAKGSNLSGGQKQRLLIARALAGKPEILILDDSSSALDYKTDSNLRKAIREYYKNTTLIMIAQRTSSIMNLDHILVLEEGEMLGYGTHEELLKTCQVYQEIYQSQMGGEG
jgi:ATP-binding cassette, subfamily B, multidrug efflux pump